MSTSTSSSYVFPSEQWSRPAPAQEVDDELASENDDLDSLPSSIDSSEESSEYSSDAQKEWEASLQQIELLLTMVVVPYVGKYFGRKCAYWSEFRSLGCIYQLRRHGPSAARLGTVANHDTQAGQNTWNGCTQLKSDIRTRRRLKRPELLKQRRHYRTVGWGVHNISTR